MPLQVVKAIVFTDGIGVTNTVAVNGIPVQPFTEGRI